MKISDFKRSKVQSTVYIYSTGIKMYSNQVQRTVISYWIIFQSYLLLSWSFATPN